MTLVESNPAHGGACGQCGYAVRGLTTFVCPECGADLRQVGIVRPDVAATRIEYRPGSKSWVKRWPDPDSAVVPSPRSQRILPLAGAPLNWASS